MKRKKYLFIALIVSQITIITFLGIKIYKKSKNVMRTTSINPIKKDTLIFTPSETLKYFYEPKPNSQEKINEWIPYSQEIVNTINSDSLNERYEYSINKPKDTFRIITLGDSYTFGLYVNTKDNWSEKLEDLLNEKNRCSNIKKFDVINLGVQGYDQIYSVERFKKRGAKYNPDLVIWMLIDFLRVNEKIRPEIDRLWKKTHEDGTFDEANKNGDYYFVWRSAVSKVYQELGKENIYNYQKWALNQLNNYWKGKLIFAIPPWSLNSEQRVIVEDFKNSRSHTFLFTDLTDLTKIGEVFPNDGHPTLKGHQKIAEEVFNYLTKNKIIPCN